MEVPPGANEWRMASVGAGGSTASCTKAAIPGARHVVTHITASVNGAPTAGCRLILNDGVINSALAYMPNGTIDIECRSGMVQGLEGQALTITTDAVGGALVPFLNVFGYTIEA